MSDLLSLGAAGVRGYGRALATIGDNVANAQTPGYARRSTTLTEQPPSGDLLLYRGQINPGGVRATGVTRATDPWLVEDARVSAGDAGRSGARVQWLQTTEASLDNGGAGVGKAMTAFFNRADELAADPANSARRSAFLGAVDQVASTFRTTANGLERTADGVATSAQGTVAQLNTDIEALQRVNEGLRRARDGSSNQASLLDERDRLLDRIATALPVQASFDGKGVATLTLPGGPLLDGALRETVTLVVAGTGTLSLSAGSFAVAPTSGSLSGLIDAASHVAGQRSALDTLATDFAAQLNAQHSGGLDANGAAGLPLLTGTTAATLATTALTAAQVAAADGTSSNGNALAFGTLRGGGGGEAGWANLAALQSQTVASARAQDAVATARRDGSAEARDALSGVDLDREAAELMRFQQAYAAAARVIQAARETMQTILDAT